jgi:hypothetical protein
MEHHKQEPDGEPLSVAEFATVLTRLSNMELLARLDLVLLELEKRFARYAQVGSELLQMADEGLVLAVRTQARLRQAQLAAQHAEGHLQVVGVGQWSPSSTRPGWNQDPRITPKE